MKRVTKKQRRDKFLKNQLSFGKRRYGIEEHPRTVKMLGQFFDDMMKRAFDEGWRAKAMSNSE